MTIINIYKFIFFVMVFNLVLLTNKAFAGDGSCDNQNGGRCYCQGGVPGKKELCRETGNICICRCDCKDKSN